ncbi:unnamed protein product, partial [Phaeothamnion confervicola]
SGRLFLEHAFTTMSMSRDDGGKKRFVAVGPEEAAAHGGADATAKSLGPIVVAWDERPAHVKALSDGIMDKAMGMTAIKEAVLPEQVTSQFLLKGETIHADYNFRPIAMLQSPCDGRDRVGDCFVAVTSNDRVLFVQYEDLTVQKAAW